MADNIHFKAKIVHTEDTIEKLYIAQYHEYGRRRMLVRFLCGMVIIMAAAFGSFPTWLRTIMLLIGAWLVTTGDFPARIKADKVSQTRNGVFPVMEYSFLDKDIRISGEGTMKVPYKKIIKLVKNSRYLYLFISSDSICMIDIQSITPEKTEEFKQFVSDKTGLQWKNEFSLVSLNYYDIKDMFIRGKNKAGK